MQDDHGQADVDLAAFLARVREALSAREMSQADLARRLGVRAATVTEWFSQGRVPGGLLMLRLPRLLGVRPAWLFSGEGPRDRQPPAQPTDEGEVRELLESVRSTLSQLQSRYGTLPADDEGPGE